MSHILFQGHNLVVEGTLGQEFYCKPESNIDTDRRVHIYLRFIVQVNGGMKIFEHFIPLTRAIEGVTHDVQGWAIENWDIWYTLRSVFNGFGYHFCDEKFSEIGGDSHTICSWIDKILKADQEFRESLKK